MRGLRTVVLMLLATVPVHAENWRNEEGGRFTFETTFEGETLGGAFRKFDLHFDFNPTAPETAKLVVTVALAAADLGDPDMNTVLFDKAWFDIEQFGRAVFESNSIEAGPSRVSPGQASPGQASPGQASPGQASPGQAFVARGVLNLKGVARPMAVPFTWLRDGKQARMGGAFSLRRTDFGVGTGDWSTGDAVGLDVRLNFDIPLALIE